MQPEYRNGNITARCPDCAGAVTTFEYKDSSHEHGSVVVNQPHSYSSTQYTRVIYKLLKCAGCSRAGVAKLHDKGQVQEGKLEWFFPSSIEPARLPVGVPQGIEAEFREAELCVSTGAWRAASGLLRSTLEKVLRANGYTKGSLADRIDQASSDGIITEARRKRAHDDVRVLGNDVLHDEWREVKPEEVHQAHHYVQRITEDFYDDRPSVEAILVSKERITIPTTP